MLLTGTCVAAQRKRATLMCRARIFDVLRLPERLVCVLVYLTAVTCRDAGFFVVAHTIVQIAGAQ